MNCFRPCLMHTIQKNIYTPHSIKYSPQGHTLASIYVDGTIHICDTHTGEVKYVLKKGESKFEKDGDKSLNMFRQMVGRIKEVFIDDTNSMEYAPNGRTMAVCGSEANICLYDTETGDLKHILQGDNFFLQLVPFTYSPDSRMFAYISRDAAIHILDVETGDINIFQDHNDIVFSMTYAPDSRTLAYSVSNAIHLLDIETRDIKIHYVSEPVLSMTYSPDGHTLAYTCDDNLYLLNVDDTDRLELYGIENNTVASLVYSPDGRTIASTSCEKICLINVEDQRSMVHRIHIYNGSLIAYSPDSSTFAYVSDKMVYLVDVETGDVIHTLKHNAKVHSIAYSPDGYTLSTASRDRKVNIWALNEDTYRLHQLLKGEERLVAEELTILDDKELRDVHESLWDAGSMRGDLYNEPLLAMDRCLGKRYSEAIGELDYAESISILLEA